MTKVRKIYFDQLEQPKSSLTSPGRNSEQELVNAGRPGAVNPRRGQRDTS
jgi:hypothetical protein